MGICWSEPPVQPNQGKVVMAPVVSAPISSAPPYQPYYTYAVKPEDPYSQYPPQLQYTYAYPQPQQYQQQYVVQQYPQQQRQQMSPATAFIGGMVLGAVVDDILDPCD